MAAWCPRAQLLRVTVGPGSLRAAVRPPHLGAHDVSAVDEHLLLWPGVGLVSGPLRE